MDILSALTGCGLIVSAHCALPITPVKPVESWRPTVTKAATTFQLPEAWVSAVMAQESGGKTVLNGKPITSKAGAMGLMQLMPDTYEDMRRQFGLGPDAYDPRDNIVAGTAYLRQMYIRYGYPGMFAAYNAGPGRFDDYLLRQRPLPNETLAYVAKIAPGAETPYLSARHPIVGLTPRVAAPRSRAQPEALFVSLNARSALFVPLSQPNP